MPNQRQQDRASLWFGKQSRLKKLVNMEQMVIVGTSVNQPCGGGPRSRFPIRPRTQHDSTHRENKVIIFLSTASTPSDTSSCRTGTRRSAGALVRSFKAWLRQFSFSRSAKVGDHPASMRSDRSSVADSRHTDERARDTSSEATPHQSSRLERSSTVTSLYHWLETF